MHSMVKIPLEEVETLEEDLAARSFEEDDTPFDVHELKL